MLGLIEFSIRHVADGHSRGVCQQADVSLV
jgi:hypothetical protein